MIIKKYSDQYPITVMCHMLGVSKSGYYAWRNRSSSNRAESDRLLSAEIKSVFKAEKCRSGSPRITKILRNKGIRVGENRVARLMRINNLCAKAAKKYKATTNSNHNLPVADILLKQDFNANRENEKWVSDITYIATQ